MDIDTDKKLKLKLLPSKFIILSRILVKYINIYKLSATLIYHSLEYTIRSI